MIEVITSLGPWSWIILGGILLAVELIAPGAFILWLGVSAILVGVVFFFVAWDWQGQGVGFSSLAGGSRVVVGGLAGDVVAPHPAAPAGQRQRSAVPQSPRAGLRRPGVYFGKADR